MTPFFPLRELINLKDFTFEPVINNNEVISIRVKFNKKGKHVDGENYLKLKP